MQLPPELTEQRLASLERQLEQESTVLHQVMQRFRDLDRIAYATGLLERHQSFATHIPWWPLISVLGTFSAGKSSFINHYLGYPLQRTGNQAVDDKFTVICFSRGEEVRVLPGVALDGDLRFPFFKISEEIEKVAAGEGRRIDAYLQLKTCPSEQLKGKILIDSPGFDADAQRSATLRMTDHMVDLADLVLVFFDARHPEPRAMQDTLEHLVAENLNRADFGKFLFILNQIDTAAREDNPEEVIASWQRALSAQGLATGRFYTIYNPDACVPIEDEAVRLRFEAKRDKDLAEIKARIRDIEVSRAYRIVAALEQTAHDVQTAALPRLRRAIGEWRKRVLWMDALVLGLPLVALLVFSILAEWWGGPQGLFSPPWGSGALGGIVSSAMALALGAAVAGGHFWVRRYSSGRVARRLAEEPAPDAHEMDVVRAFHASTRPWRSIFLRQPAGVTRKTETTLTDVHTKVNLFIQSLNDGFANPAG